MVAIKDMKFPNCCADCNLVELDEIDNFYCGYTHHYCNNQNNERNSDCPLVEEVIKVGKWIEEHDDYGNIIGWHCSNCYDETGFVTTCAWDYCPSCGSRNER